MDNYCIRINIYVRRNYILMGATMNSYIKHFRNEIEILKKVGDFDDWVVRDFIKNIEDITEVFANQGHSGSSAPFYSSALAETIKRVLSFDIITPLTGKDGEWGEQISNDGTLQNKRLSSVFKGDKGSYYLDAIVWKDGDFTYTGKVEEIRSRQYIKYPFMPKTFYIDVVRIYGTKEEFIKNNLDYYEDFKKGEDGEIIEQYYRTEIKDRRQLDEVAKYYNND